MRERVAAGAASGSASHRERACRGSSRPGSSRFVLVGSARPARCSAEPDAADLPRARAAVHPRRGAAAARDHPVGVARLRPRWRVATARRRGAARRARVSTAGCSPATATLPDGDPGARCRTPPADAERGALGLLHLGHDRRPEGRAAHRHDDRRRCRVASSTRFELGESDRYPIVFPFTHIGGVGMLVVQLLSGAGAIVVEQYDAETYAAVAPRARRDDCGRRYAARAALPAVPAPTSGAPRSSRAPTRPP